MTQSSEPDLHFPDELGPADVLMLKGEHDPRTRTTTLSAILLDRAPDFDVVVREFERISREFIRLRQRVVNPILPLAASRWVVDPDFAIAHHVSHQVLSAPGDLRSLLTVCLHRLEAPMDLGRPLWEVVLVEGLVGQEGRAALLLKAHHAITDGIGGLQLLRSMYDFEPDAVLRPMPLQPIPDHLTEVDVLRRGMLRDLGQALPQARARSKWLLDKGRDLLREPAESLDRLKAQLTSAQRVLGDPPAAPSPLLRRRGLNRRLFATEFPLALIKASAKRAGCSVNDAYLAGVGAGLRLYHEAKGLAVDEVSMAIPVNVRRDGDPAGGNRFAGARIAVPIAEKDPALRMQVIRQRMRSAVDEPALPIMDLIGPVMARLPTPALEFMARSVSSIDIQASNVPGLPDAPYFAGSKVLKFYPFGPLPGVAMMIILYSQARQCYVGVHYDTDSFDEPELLERCLEQGFDETLGGAREQRKPVVKSRRSAQPSPRPAQRVRKQVSSRRSPRTGR